jgi:hypothetical protein
MTKLELQSIIEKYHLDGLVENVKWIINKDKSLSIDFTSPSREMIGSVVYNDFPLPESSIGINNTSQLYKLLSITTDDLILDLSKEQKVITKLLISDKQFSLNYSLADILTVPKVGKYTGTEDYDIETTLNDDIIGALIKAKNASNSENVLLELNSGIVGDLQLDFIFNGDVEYANKVTYTIKEITSKTSIGFNLKYSSELLKQIFVNNKGADLGKLFLNSNGLMKLVFEYKDLKSTYYVVAKEI